jgi:hypothetical protein
MELARAWFRTAEPSCPAEVLALLATHPLTEGLELVDGRPEHVTPLPEHGEGRHHDLWLRSRVRGEPVTICIEAKGDEPFGEPIGRQLRVARKRQPQTGVPARARTLLRLLFGRDCHPEAAPWNGLRYQLLTALAGTVIQAANDDARLGVLIVHEFRAPIADARKLALNQQDLDAFLALLMPGTAPLEAGRLMGPIEIAPNELTPNGLHLLVGKLVVELDPAQARS